MLLVCSQSTICKNVLLQDFAVRESQTVSPLGTSMSASLMLGSMYCSKAGFTNLLYCLMTPSMSRPRSVMSLRSRRTSRMSESVSTKIFISRSCRWEEQTPPNGSITFTSAKQLLKQKIPGNDCFTSLKNSSKRKKEKKQKTYCLTWRSSLSAKDIIPSNMITLAPYTFFCIKRRRNREASKQKLLHKQSVQLL